MPSFKANVEGIAASGELLVSVDVNSCIPEDLGCNMASVNVGVGVPTGIYVMPQALTLFPADMLDDFSLGQTVKISWRAEGPIMTNLKIRAAT
jgi:hypothetical protein